MRILMTADAVGGVWSYALELAGALREHRVHVHLATMGPRPTPAQRDEASRLDNLTLHASDFRLEWMEEPWEDVARAGDWLLALERTLAPDLVHLNGYAHGALPWRAPVVVAAHSCVCSWWRAVHGTDAPPHWERYRAAVAGGLSGAALVVAPSRAMLDAVAEHYGPPRSRRVVPNGRTAAAYPPGVKQPIVLAAGRVWDAAKNLAALVAAAPRAPWPVVIAGDDAPPVGAEGTTGLAAGAAGGVRFLGLLPQRRLAAWFGRAAIFALPARYEPFGLSALEAGLARCALVLGDVPSLREVWGDAPVYVDPASPRALGDALRALAADEALREEHAHRCRARALGYTPERMAIGYLDAYAAAAQEATCAS